MNATATTLSNKDLRKAAVLIATLDTRTADALLDKMAPESADQVRRMIMEMDEVDPSEQDEVVREFFQQAGGKETRAENDGVELSIGGAIPEPAGIFPVPVTVEPVPRPFAFLREVRTGALARLLEHQHPQLVAVVTAHLPPAQAAELVRQLAPRTQADVLRRVAELDLADQEVLADIERELERLLGDELRASRNRQAGLATLSTILEAAGDAKQDLWNNLSRHHQDLASQLPEKAFQTTSSARPSRSSASGSRSETAHRAAARGDSAPSATAGRRSAATATSAGIPSTPVRSPAKSTAPLPAARTTRRPAETGAAASDESQPTGASVSFEDLAALSDADWATLIRESEPAVVLLALTGASESLLQRVTRRLPRREAQALRTRLQQTGPLRLSDIEHAQLRLAQLASRLIARGLLTAVPQARPDRRGFAAAA